MPPSSPRTSLLVTDELISSIDIPSASSWHPLSLTSSFCVSSAARATPPGPELRRTCRRFPESLSMRRSMPAARDTWWVVAIVAVVVVVDSATESPSAICICVFPAFFLGSCSRALSSLPFLGLLSSHSVMPSSSLERAQVRWKRACTSKRDGAS